MRGPHSELSDLASIKGATSENHTKLTLSTHLTATRPPLPGALPRPLRALRECGRCLGDGLGGRAVGSSDGPLAPGQCNLRGIACEAGRNQQPVLCTNGLTNQTALQGYQPARIHVTQSQAEHFDAVCPPHPPVGTMSISSFVPSGRYRTPTPTTPLSAPICTCCLATIKRGDWAKSATSQRGKAMNIYRPPDCAITDSELATIGLHGGRDVRMCQRCERVVCEGHSVILKDPLEPQILCSLCAKIVLKQNDISISTRRYY